MSLPAYLKAGLLMTQGESDFIALEGFIGERIELRHPAANNNRRILYHRSRTGNNRPPQASKDGTYGPGLYLTSRSRAEDYAQHDSVVATDYKVCRECTPHYAGTVYSCDVTNMQLKVIDGWHAFEVMVERVTGTRACTDLI